MYVPARLGQLVRQAGCATISTNFELLCHLMTSIQKDSQLELLCQCFKHVIRKCHPDSGAILPSVAKTNP